MGGVGGPKPREETMTDTQPIDIVSSPPSKGSSGYRRLQQRHKALIAEHEALKREHGQLVAEQQGLQTDVDNLLQQHSRLMQAARTPQPWFEGANQVLAQLSEAPDQRSLQV